MCNYDGSHHEGNGEIGDTAICLLDFRRVGVIPCTLGLDCLFKLLSFLRGIFFIIQTVKDVHKMIEGYVGVMCIKHQRPVNRIQSDLKRYRLSLELQTNTN